MKPSLLYFLVSMVFLPSVLFAQSKGEMPFTTSSPEAKKLVRQAWEAYSDIKIDEANRYIQQAIEKDPYLAIAYASRWVDNDEEVANNMAKAFGCPLSADEKMYLNGLKAALEKEPNHEYFDPLLKKYPKDYYLHLWIMFHYHDLNRSVEIGEAIIKSNPKFAPAYNLLGYKYMAKNDLEKAESCFDKYISLRPDLANVYDSKADYLMKAGKTEEAIPLYEKAFSMDTINMKGSETRAKRAKILLQGFTVPELTNVQKHIRTTNQAWWVMLAGISVAKQSGTSVKDYAIQLGDLFKYTWNKDLGFEGLAQGVLYNLETFRNQEDPEIEIIHQDKNSIELKWKSNYNMFFSEGLVFNVSLEELNEAFYLINKQISDYLGSTYEQEVDGEWLRIKISRRGEGDLL